MAVDLVALGDSFVVWSDWPEMIATDLAAALDREVVLDESLAAPGALAPYEPDLLTGDATAIDLVSGAEVLLLQPRPFMAPAAMIAFMSDACGGTSNSECLDAAIAEMRAYADDYLGLVVDLAQAGGEVVVILIGSWPVDALYPDLQVSDAGKRMTLVTFMFDLMRQVEEAASEREIAVVDVGAIFNGPEYLWVAPAAFLVEDGLHLSDAGSRVVADELLLILVPEDG